MKTPVTYPPFPPEHDNPCIDKEAVDAVIEEIKKDFASLKTGAYHDVAVGPHAKDNQIVMGSDSRLFNPRKAADVYPWAKDKKKPAYTPEEVGAASASHTHELATPKSAGFMSPADKKAVDSIPDLVSKDTIKEVLAEQTDRFVLRYDERLYDARPASDVRAWAKKPRKPEYSAEEVGAAPKNHTHKLATTSAAGFMSPEDKLLLTDLRGHNLDTATPEKNGFMSAEDKAFLDSLHGHRHDNATETEDGFMSAEDKAFLDSLHGHRHDNATETEDGFMSAEDKKWIGESLDLLTTDKRNIVHAINEIYVELGGWPLQLSYTDGTPLQGELRITSDFIHPTALPRPHNYAFYPLFSSFVEHQENFNRLLALTDEDVIPAVDAAGVTLSAEEKQYLATEREENDGIDLLGFVGHEGNRYFLAGLQATVPALPEEGTRIPLMALGLLEEKRIELFVNSKGDVVLLWSGKTQIELSIPDYVSPNRPFGVWFRHENGIVTLATDLGNQRTHHNPHYFEPTLLPENNEILFGKSYDYVEEEDEVPYINAGNVAPGIVIVDALTATVTGDNYRTVLPGAVIYPETGKYYAEMNIHESYDMHFGVAPIDATIRNTVGVTGWAINSINGRKFAQQTGGGSQFGSPIPPNSTVGMLYDSDEGTLEYFVNGNSIGTPFPIGTIHVPVTLGASFRGDAGTGSNGQISFIRPTEKAATLGAQEFPGRYLEVNNAVYGDVRLRNIFIRNEPYENDNVQTDLVDPNYKLRVTWEDSRNNKVDGSEYIIKQETGEIVTYVPEIAPGVYYVRVETPREKTRVHAFTVKPFRMETTPLLIDFSSTSYKELDKHLYKAHKQWGGINGGVIKENVFLDQEKGALICRGLGDEYAGPLRGVDRVGNPTEMATRMGGCFATKGYYGAGSYIVDAVLPFKDGVVTAFWTFHYEEGYPGTPVFEEHINDGLRQQGDEENGFYTVRNHEIDIEIPTALKGSPDMEVVSYSAGRFNAWLGEARNWDVDEDHPEYWTEYTDMFTDFGHLVNDGQRHEFRFDWHVHPVPKIEFYIDGVLAETVTTSVPNIPGRFWVGLWFPSAPGNHWAGKEANFDIEDMEVYELKILPFAEQNAAMRIKGETYPNDGWASFTE